MRENKNTKKMIVNAFLLGIGAILHQITPALGLPMQPDFALVMLFIIMIINDGDYKTSLISGIITGVFTAMTTKFPGGQLPNIIDKLVTANIVFVIIFIINKIKPLKKISEKKREIIKCIIVFPIGTLISGLVFLFSASKLVGLPAQFKALFISIVIPAVIINLIIGCILFKIVKTSIKKANIIN